MQQASVAFLIATSAVLAKDYSDSGWKALITKISPLFVCAPETYMSFSDDFTVNAQMQLVKKKQLSKSNHI